MEDVIVQDLLIAREEMLAAYENLTQAEKEFTEIDGIVRNLNNAVEAITAYGFTDELKTVLNQDNGLVDLCKVDIASITVEKATEGFAEAVKTGFQKAWEAIKKVIAYIGEFLAKLFNTTNYKIEQILKAPKRINFDKVVMTSTKDKIGSVSKDIAAMHALSKKWLATNMLILNTTDMYTDLHRSIALSNVLVFDKDHPNKCVQLHKQAVANMFEQMTLGEAKFSINDIIGLCWRFRDKARNYTAIGSIMRSIANDQRISDLVMYSTNREIINTTFLKYKIDTAVYSMIAQLQSMLAKQIDAFFKSMDELIVKTNPEGGISNGNQLSYAA